MLEELRISGLGVVESAEAEFSSGFTVLTGETGAGKTMIVTSLHLLSGARADASRVRVGAERAVVEGRFTAGSDVDELLEAAGAERDEDGTVIAVRSVTAQGRSRASLGARSVPVGTLGQFTSSTLAIHGQNDQLGLMRADRQRAALDRYAGGAAERPLTAYRKARKEWLALSATLTERRDNERALAQEADRLTYALGEIDALGLTEGEDVELTATIRRLGDLESIREAAVTAQAALVGVDGDGDGAASDALGHARAALERAEDEQLRALGPRVGEALAIVADVTAEVGSYLSGLPVDADDLQRLLERQGEVRAVTRKYAADVDGTLAWAAAARERLAGLDTSAEAIADLERRADEARERVVKYATALTTARVGAAKRLAREVSAELKGLAMGGAALAVDVRPDVTTHDAALQIGGRTVAAGPDGVDIVEFALTAHSGAPALPIAKSASGGELSRVMLALEVVLAADDAASTMVFDEVDAGVGGQAAVRIGERLAKLSRTHQVIVVTHLPQVAAFADHHLHIGKRTTRGKGPTSTLTALRRDDRIAELARMLAGLGDSDTGRAHAEELLAAAEAVKAG